MRSCCFFVSVLALSLTTTVSGQQLPLGHRDICREVLLDPATALARLPDDVWWKDSGCRIRPKGTWLAAALLEGVQQSPTLREIALSIEAGDVIVYLESVTYLKRSLLGSLRWIGSGGNLRFVRATFKAAPHTKWLIATIAHELQHVQEIGDATWVTGAPHLSALYQAIGHRVTQHDEVWDTKAANRIEDQVRREVEAYEAAAASADR